MSFRYANFAGYMFIAGFILGGMGFYSIYGAMKKVPVIIISDGSKYYEIPLEKMEKEVNQLVHFLKENHLNVSTEISLHSS